MKLPADVLNDLLALYASGEASPGTRAIVEQEMKNNPELASRLNLDLKPEPLSRPSPDACLKSLNRVKQYHLLRMFLLGFAIITLIVPLHPFFWDNAARSKKTFVAVSESVSAMSWAMFAYYSQLIRKAGLR